MLALLDSDRSRGAPTRVPHSSTRSQLRARLRPLVPRIRHLAILAEQAIEGPDPEAALVFLSMLRRKLNEALLP